MRTVLGAVQPFARATLKTLSTETQRYIDLLTELLLFNLTRGSPPLNVNQVRQLLQSHQAFTNLVYLSSFESPDSFLMPRSAGLESRPELWPLVSVRSSRTLDLRDALGKNPLLASEWYGQYFFGVRSFVSRSVLDRLCEHMCLMNGDLSLVPSVSNGYMRSTYIDPESDRRWKASFNRLVKKSMPVRSLIATETSATKRIAVLTARWASQHPTYKNRYKLFKRLAQDYDLVLVHLGKDREDLELDLFKEKINVELTNKGLDVAPLRKRSFALAFYPDIGMNLESRFLSNFRIAPAQVTTNSHPVSTFGSEIDYFLTGVDSEREPEEASQYYSERLVLIPGIGTQPNQQHFKPGSLASGAPELDRVTIACPWGCLKINANLVQSLRSVVATLDKQVRLIFLVTLGQDNNHYWALKKDLTKELHGLEFELHADLPYVDYMKHFARCDLAIDAFPFGGNTSIVDAMHLKVPMLSRKGWQFYNRAGAVILEKAGLGDLVAHTQKDLERKAYRLVHDASFRERIKICLDSIKISQLLDGLTDPDAFHAAVKNLIEKRPDPNDRRPLKFL